MDVTRRVGVGDVLLEDRGERELLQSPLGDGHVGRLGIVRHIGVLFVLEEHYPLDVIGGHAEPGMALVLLLQTALDQSGVHQLAHEARGDVLDARVEDRILDLDRDLVGLGLVEIRLAHERARDAAPVPLDDGVVGRTDEKREIGRLVLTRQRLLDALTARAAAQAAALLAVENEGLGGLGVPVLDQHLLDRILDFLDLGSMVAALFVDVAADFARQLLGQRAVLTTARTRRHEDGRSYLARVELNYFTVPLRNLAEQLAAGGLFPGTNALHLAATGSRHQSPLSEDSSVPRQTALASQTCDTLTRTGHMPPGPAPGAGRARAHPDPQPPPQPGTPR